MASANPPPAPPFQGGVKSRGFFPPFQGGAGGGSSRAAPQGSVHA
jgi:hypothetical protein